MFVVWAYLWVTYWDAFYGGRVIVEIVCKHMVPATIGPRWARHRQRPEQKASTYG